MREEKKNTFIFIFDFFFFFGVTLDEDIIASKKKIQKQRNQKNF